MRARIGEVVKSEKRVVWEREFRRDGGVSISWNHVKIYFRFYLEMFSRKFEKMFF